MAVRIVFCDGLVAFFGLRALRVRVCLPIGLDADPSGAEMLFGEDGKIRLASGWFGRGTDIKLRLIVELRGRTTPGLAEPLGFARAERRIGVALECRLVFLRRVTTAGGKFVS